MNHAYLLLGGNQGNTVAILQNACLLLQERAGHIQLASPLYQTAAWGKTDQPDFLNQALLLHTHLDAPTLLQYIQDIEALLGRERNEHWGQRTIDIDILFFNREVVHSPTLTVPHPRLADRRFVLVPLCAIAADFTHPVSGSTMQELLDNCPDKLEVFPFNATSS